MKIAFACLLLASAFALAKSQITAWSAGIAYVLTNTAVLNGAVALIGTAIAGGLATNFALNSIRAVSRRRRDAEVDLALFEAIDEQDPLHCAKLLVCHSFAKDEAMRTGEERAIVNLFDDLTVIQENAYGKFQWAAYAGTFKNPSTCHERYSQCPVNVEELGNLVKVQ